MLAKCCAESEKCLDYRKLFNDTKLYSPAPYGTAESVAAAAVSAVLDLKVDLIVIFTDTGKLTRLVAKYKPEVSVITASSSDIVLKQVTALRGVIGVYVKPDMDED